MTWVPARVATFFLDGTPGHPDIGVHLLHGSLIGINLIGLGLLVGAGGARWESYAMNLTSIVAIVWIWRALIVFRHSPDYYRRHSDESD